MAKTPAKGKKAPAAKKAPAKASRAPKNAKAPVSAADEDGAGDKEDEDDDDFDSDEAPPKAAAKPAAHGSKKPGKAGDPDAPPAVPARRLTPEAKAKVNEMVKKGMPLGDALKAAASWETFVAPVKEEQPKIGAGRPFEGGPRPPRPRRTEDDDGPSNSPGFDEADEEPASTIDADE
jgi:hypothetical protein